MKTAHKLICVFVAAILIFPTLAFAADELFPNESAVCFSEQITLVKGKSEYATFKNADEDVKVKYKSSDKKVATVSSTGKIKGKACGIAKVTATAEKDGYKYKSEITVNVIISKYAVKKTYGKETETVEKTESAPYINIYKHLPVKGTSKIKVKCAEGDSITYKSNNPKVVSVNESGKIKALKKGNAAVTATVKSGGEKYVFKENIKVLKSATKSITKKQRNKFFSTSAFVGSSIGVGQKSYFDSQGKNYLGHPLMLVRGCYSFNNDKKLNKKYVPQYKGVSMRAKDAIKKSGVDKVFISMGTNDFYGSAQSTFNNYKEYLEGIRKKNPKVVIFIESTTGVHASHQKKTLNSKNVKKMNKLLKAYCAEQKDMYFIDVTSCMLDKNGHLRSDCCSDSYVHLSSKGYALWMEQVTKYTDKYMVKQQEAEDAVATAEESKNKTQKERAKKLVNALDDSSFKSSLNKRIKKI